jgi:repressor of nif and glnA expression
MLCRTSIAILKILSDSEDPISYKIIKRYLLRNFDRISIHNSLKNLSRYKLIQKSGHKKAYLYSISSLGIDRLWFYNKLECRNKMIKEVDNILLRNGGLD